MLFYQNTLADMEAVRDGHTSQNYRSLQNELSILARDLNIDNIEYWYNNFRIVASLKEHQLINRYKAVETIRKIKSSIPITDISLEDLIRSYWWDSLDPESKDICTGYDVAPFFKVFYSIEDNAIRLLILDKLIWELGLRDSIDDPDSVVVMEYLTRFRELIQSQPEQTLQKQPQEQIYFIPTSLTEKQLVALLGRLKENGFIAPEQTEEDFLNAFNPNATKQGKIHWGKVGNKRKGINATTIIYFIHKTNDKLTVKYPQKDVIAIIRSIFEIEVTKVNLSTTKSKIDNGENIEYKEEVDRLFEHI